MLSYILICIFDFIAIFSTIYHEILRIYFLHKNTKFCFFLSQLNWVYAKITVYVRFEN